MSVDPVSIGIKVVLMAAQMALTATQRIKGPRLSDLSTTLASYGSPIPRFWGKRVLTPQIIHAEKLREVKHTSKTKGGKYDEYKYYATFAVLICDHQIDAVSKIWMDKHLVYQATGAGPTSPVGLFSVGETLTNGQNMRVYLGTETQNPDPRIESWCDAKYGANTAPAYRGCSYIMFEEFPVEKFGNRIPQIDVEVVSAKSTTKPYESRTTTISTSFAYFAINGTWLLFYGQGGSPLEWWDLPTRTRLGTVAGGGGYPFLNSNVALRSNGSAFWYGIGLSGSGTAFFKYECGVLGATAQTVVSGSPGFTGAGPARAINDETFCAIPGTGYVRNLGFVSDTQSGRDFFLGPDGDIWALFEPLGSSNQFTLQNLTHSATTTFTGLTTRTGFGSPNGCYVPLNNEFFISADGNFYRINATTMTITASGTAAWGEAAGLPAPGPTSFWNGFDEYSLSTGSLLRSVSAFDWVFEATNPTVYDPISNALVSRSSMHLTWRYLDRIGSTGVQLRDVVNTVAGWCGVTVDATALDQTVLGYSVTQGAGKDMISPLLDIHDSDCRPHDFTVQFIKRGGASLGTLLTPEFAISGGNARYTATITQDTDLPQKITLNYADDTNEQQTNTALSSRNLDSVKTVRQQSIDMTTYASTPTEAQPLTDRYFRRQWNEREQLTFALTAQRLAIEPGDVWTASLDGLTRNVRCIKATLSGDALKCEWKRDEQTLNLLTSNPGAPLAAQTPDTIYVPGPTKGFVLDIPLIKDADAQTKPSLYFAAGPYAATSWPGAVVYKKDGADFVPWAAVDSAAKATWGTTTNALGNANSWLWDRGNSANVMVQSGTLVSTTEAAIDADTTLNLAYLGGELLQFTTATLQGDGSYTLTGLKRGRRGTEGKVGTHAAGEDFVLVASFDKDALGLDELGTAEAYRVATQARDPSTASEIDLTFSGATLKPYAAARVAANFDGTDWTFTVIRRTRLGGAWVGGTTIPLSENSEAYDLEIYSGSTLKRTLKLVGTNVASWTNAMQVTDFGATQSTKPSLIAYQLSDAVGRGFALAA